MIRKAMYFYHNAKFLDGIDEFKLYCKHKSIDLLPAFLNKYPNKSFLIQFENIDDVFYLKHYYTKNNVSILLPTEEVKNLQHLRDTQYPIIISAIVSNFEQLYNYITIGVAGVYLGGELLHRLPQTKRICKEHNIQTRLFVDISGSLLDLGEKNYSIFIPRPENSVQLSKYIDVFDFYSQQPDILTTLYKIWFVHKKWVGDINQIILFGYFDNFSNQDFPETVFSTAIKCGNRCLYEENPTCHLCQSSINLANKMQEKNIHLQIKDV